MNSIHVVLCLVLVSFTFGVLGLLWYLDRQDKREEASDASESPTYFIRVDDYHPLCSGSVRQPPKAAVPKASGLRKVDSQISGAL